MHADPAELRLQRGEVYYEGQRVDLAYRDYAVGDLIDLEAEGVDIEPMRALFRQNRIISSITAELDQKSCWEVLTDPQFTQKYFSADERQVFRRHILWTRMPVRPPDRAARRPAPATCSTTCGEHEALVLKPNRAYGGDGVVIGPAVDAREWEAALEAALADPTTAGWCSSSRASR